MELGLGRRGRAALWLWAGEPPTNTASPLFRYLLTEAFKTQRQTRPDRRDATTANYVSALEFRERTLLARDPRPATSTLGHYSLSAFQGTRLVETLHKQVPRPAVSQSPGPGPPGGLPAWTPVPVFPGANTNTSLTANRKGSCPPPAPWTSRSPPPPREGPPLSSPPGAPTPANSSPGPAGTSTQQEIGQYFGSIVQKDRFCYIVQIRKLSYEQRATSTPNQPPFHRGGRTLSLFQQTEGNLRTAKGLASPGSGS